MNSLVMREKLAATPEGQAFLKVIDAAGGAAALASLINVKRQTVDNWIYLSGHPSAQGAIAIEAIIEGVTKEDLRPDVTDWDVREAKGKGELIDKLSQTGRGEGLLAVLKRVKNSKRALANLLGLSSPHLIQNWIARGYVPKHHVRRILELPEFDGLTAEIIRPDLHELDY